MTDFKETQVWVRKMTFDANGVRICIDNATKDGHTERLSLLTTITQILTLCAILGEDVNNALAEQEGDAQ